MRPEIERCFDPRRQQDVWLLGFDYDFLMTIAIQSANAGRVNGYPNVETWTRTSFDKIFRPEIDNDEDS